MSSTVDAGTSTVARPPSVARNRLTVAFLSHTSHLGGAERALLELVEGLRRDVDCIVFLPAEGPLGGAFKAIGVRCRVVKYSWWSNPVRRVRRNCNNALAVFRLARELKSERVDLVYSNTMLIPSGAFAAKLCGLPHIWHVHEFGREDHGLRFDVGERLGRRLVGALSDKVICVSDAVKSKFAGIVADDKLTTVYGTVTLRDGGPARARASAAVRCVLVGVLRPSKGQKDAVRAIDTLVRDGKDVTLTLVGSGPMEGELRDLVASLHLEDRVHLVGYVDNPFPYIEDADILLMCSRSEALGRALIEAMMVGKPVIGSRSGGAVELIRDHFNGLLYTPGDVGDLTEKIRVLADDLAYARSLGANGRAWSRTSFAPENFVGGVLRNIETVMRESRRGR